MNPQAWVWRSIGLAVVAVAIVAALWFMSQVGGAIGGITFATPTETATPAATSTAVITSPSVSPSASVVAPPPSPTPKKKPTPTPKR